MTVFIKAMSTSHWYPALKAAMKEYTKRDQSRYGDMNIAKVAYPKFKEKLQVCKDLVHGYDFSGFMAGSPLDMAKAVTGGVNFVLDPKKPDLKDLFLKEAMLLKQAHSLCSSMTTEQERHEAAYMEAIRSTVIKVTYGGAGGKTLSLKEINDQINELLKASIQSEGVISLFDSKNNKESISLFDPAVLEEISKMKEKNIGLLIWGDVGCGKSFLAGAIANALIDQEVRVKMTNFTAILNDLSSTFEGRNEYLNRLCSYPLLIIDDFGMERGTEYGLEQVYSVIDGRYRSKKPLIVTTNLTLTELRSAADTAHKRIYDRVLDMCVPIFCKGESFRKHAAEDKLTEMKRVIDGGADDR